MTIYALKEILSSKSHNPHYLNRYIRFIESCRILNENYIGYTEKHHICPQAKDLFPEYKSLRKHSWNCAILTPRQHFIAHHLLWKAYPEMKSMRYAFFMLNHINDNKLDSKTYSRLSEENSKNHHFLGEETNRKRVENRTHPFLGGEIQRESALKRVRLGTHHCLGSVACYDKKGTFVRVPKEIYHSQTGPMEDWDYVHFSSKEAKRRKTSLLHETSFSFGD